MYPAQTSFIPVQVALARFLAENGWRAALGNYPYWYLGTTPYRYLTGPILPSVVVGLRWLLPGLNLFEIILGLNLLAFLFGGATVYFLVKALGAKRSAARLTTVFYLFGPLLPFLFRFDDGLSLISFSFLSVVLLVYLNFLQRSGWKQKICCVLAMLFLILLNSLMLPTLFLGMVAIFLATSGEKEIKKKFRQTLAMLAVAFFLTTLWYTPGYWWQLLKAPSLAGKSLFQVGTQIGQLLPITLALVLGWLAGKNIKIKSQLTRFCFYWLFIFGFLTLMRFIADPDFWLDWLLYGKELQLGLALALIWLLEKLSVSLRQKYAIVAIWMLFFLFLTQKYVWQTFQQNVAQTVEYQVGQYLAKTVKPNEAVFLSGTTGFWLNAFFDVVQAKGGNDRASVDHYWRRAAWEIREGHSVAESVEWLERLRVSFLVVHDQTSDEFYHDFCFPEKFAGAPRLKKIYDQQGDRIYQLLD